MMRAACFLLILLAASAACVAPETHTVAREHWRVDGYLLRTRQPGEYLLRLQKYPGMAFGYTVDPSAVRLVVRDHRGREVPGIRASVTDEMPAPGRDYRDPDSPGMKNMRALVEESRLPPGMYTVGARVQVDATDAVTGQPISLPETVTWADRFYKTPEPEFSPALLPGRKFLFEPREDADLVEPAPPGTPPYRPDPDDPSLPRPPRRVYRMPYTDAGNGAPMSLAPLVLRVFTLKSNDPGPDGMRALTFSVEGRPGLVRLVTDRPATDLPHLSPVLLDANVRRLNTKYEGKAVWMSAAGVICVTDDPNESGGFGFDARRPVLIRRVVRVWRPNQMLAIGGAPGYMGPRDSEYSFDNPVIVVVELPKGTEVQSLSWSGFGAPGEEDFSLQSLPGLCAGVYTIYSDAWDMERDMAVQDPRALRDRWPKAYRKAVDAGEVMKGMTPDMVVQVLGWPNEYATPEEMRRWTEWRYDSTPPFNYWVRFRNGRVASFGPDGTLP